VKPEEKKRDSYNLSLSFSEEGLRLSKVSVLSWGQHGIPLIILLKNKKMLDKGRSLHK